MQKTGASLFLTGKAGTGKTTFLHNLISNTRKRVVVTAPTGIAAINAGGVTLHSFFQLDFAPYVPGSAAVKPGQHKFSKEKLKIIRGMDLLVIDEISMVRADVLDAVDDVLRRLRDRTRPFGGVQLLLIGDLRQLAPVVPLEERQILQKYYPTPYFFDSKALSLVPYETIELTEVFRQKDEQFLGLLNAIRDNRADENVLRQLNRRYIRGFEPQDDLGYIRLTTHNRMADAINRQKLESLPSQEYVFECNVEGKFPEHSYPADENLKLKVGAQVMFIKNDTGMDREYYNGMLGTVVAIDPEEGVAVQPMDRAEIINVHPVEWENVSYTVDEETKNVVSRREGVFSQLPLRTAWAVTIHKSQGLTFDRAIIDVEKSFAHGQAYVALSRCRTLDGIVLANPIPASAIISDPTVADYMNTHNCDNIDDPHIKELEAAYKVNLLDDLFSFRQMFAALEGVVRLYQENFVRMMPAVVSEWANMYENRKKAINEVADKFRLQYGPLARAGVTADSQLQERIKAACNYFLGQLKPIEELSIRAIRNSDNKSVQTKLTERLTLFEDLLTTKRLLLGSFRTRDFNTELYLDLKAEVMLRDAAPYGRKSKKIKVPKVLKDPKDFKDPKDPKDIGPISPIGPIDPARNDSKKAKKPKASRLPKVPTAQVTLQLFRQGLTPDEIAEHRGLTIGTITNHLLATLSKGEFEDMMIKQIPSQTRRNIQDYLDRTPELPGTLTEIRNAIGGEPEWDHIRFMLRMNNRELGPMSSVVKEPEAPYGSPEDFLE